LINNEFNHTPGFRAQAVVVDLGTAKANGEPVMKRRLLFKSDGLYNASQGWQARVLPSDGSAEKYVLDGLSEDTCYTVKLQSMNALGWGPATPSTSICCTLSMAQALSVQPGEIDSLALMMIYIAIAITAALVLLIICVYLKH